MKYPEFREQIFHALEEIIPKDIHIQMQCTAKLNNNSRYGISFQAQDSDICPTIYLEPFYKAFQQGTPMEQLAKELFACYNEETDQLPEEIGALSCFESARENIYMKLIHTMENEVLLEDTPHVPFMDFSLVCYFTIDNDKISKGSVLIKKEYLDYWAITQEELLSCAAANTRKKKQVYFCPITEMLASCLQEFDSTLLEPAQHGMFVLTDREKYLGAVVICFEEVAHMLFEKLQESYYLLPSSVHEWIIVPHSYAPDTDKLLAMVQQINDTEVMPEEVLSYNVYYFDAVSQKIHIYQSRKYKKN